MTNNRIPFRAASVAFALFLMDAFVLNQAVLPILAGASWTWHGGVA